MSSPWQDTNTPDYGEPPSYGSTPPSHNVPASERTHLMSFGLKRKKYLGLIIALSVIGLIMFTVYGPYIMSGVASQRAKWNQELGERRAEEQIRRQDWEQQLKREQYQEEIKQSEERERWYNELEERRADEYSRADTWERQFKERKFRDEMRHEEEQKKLDDEIEERRAEERSKEAAWERQLKERKHEEQRRRDNWNERLHRARLREEEWERKWNQMQKTARRKEAQRQELERSREEQWQREEEERQSLGLYWEEPTVEPRCTAYNTRKYWARLLNTIPYDYNWLKPCQSMPMVFHGRNITTTQCHIDGDEVYGHWLVDFDEPNCTPYWDQFKDKVRYTLTDETLSQKYLHHLKDCTAQGSGLRRIEAHLEGIYDGEDGEKLCVSAPYDFYGQHYERPKSCVNWGTHGIFGIWEVDDPDCH